MPPAVGHQVRSWYRKNTDAGVEIEVIKTHVRGEIRYVTCRANDVVLFDMPLHELQRYYTRFDKK